MCYALSLHLRSHCKKDMLPYSSVSGQNIPETGSLRWVDARPMRPSLCNVESVFLMVFPVASVYQGKGARAVERSKYSGISFDDFRAISFPDCNRRNIEEGRCQSTTPFCTCGTSLLLIPDFFDRTRTQKAQHSIVGIERLAWTRALKVQSMFAVALHKPCRNSPFGTQAVWTKAFLAT